MAGGNMGALDFSLGIRDNFSKPLEQLEKKLNEVSSYANKDLKTPIEASYKKSLEEIKKGINKLQYAWDDVDAAVAKVTEKHPFADTSSFDKVRDKIKDIATEFMSIVQTTNKFDMDWSKKLTGFFKSADVDFQMHQITALSKAAQNEVNASTKAEEEYWKKEQKAIDRATASYANIGKEFMSLSKIKAGLLNQEFASPKDEATTMAAVKSLDQYIEVMKKAKQQYVDLADQGRAQESILGKGGAALGQVFSSEYWTTKNGAVETMRMALTNWKALTQEQKEEKRQALAAIDAIVANNKTAANASKGIEQQEKRNEQAFVAEQKAIDATTERYAKLRSLLSEGLAVRKDSNFLGVNTDRFTEKLQGLANKVLELRSAYNAGTYSTDLFDKGKSKVEIDEIKELIKAYKDLNKEKSKEVAGKVYDNVNLKTGGIDTSVFEKGLAQAKQLKDVYEQLEFYKPKLQYAWLDLESSRKVGNANNPDIRHMEDEVSRLEAKVKDLQTTFETLGGNTRLANVDNEIKGLNEAIDLLKKSAKETDLGKLLGLRNDVSSDWFTEEKRAAQAQEAHLAKEKEITEAFEEEARNVQKVNDLLEMRAHKAQMEASRPNLYQEGVNTNNTNMREAQTAVARSQEEAKQIEHARELARLKEDILRRSNQELEALRMQTTAAKDLSSAFDHVHSSASKSSQVLSDIKSLFFQGGIVFGAQQFANSILQTGGDIVQQHIALRSILGDVQKADELFNQTQQLALQSPFKFQELNRDVKQLAAFGVDTDKLYDTTKRLADVASGLGVSFERLGLAYGQVKSRSWLDGKELRQFAYAGLPMLQKIADLYNEEGKNGRHDYTTSDVRNMITKRLVSFEDVDKVFQKLTDEGGQFYNMQFVLSDTLLGKWNKLQDAWTIMLGKFADGSNILGKTFKFVIDAATQLVQMGDSLSPMLLSFGAAFGGKRILSDVQNRFGVGSIVNDMKKAEQVALSNFSIRQATRVAEGEITLQQAKQNIAAEKNLLASKETANMKYMQLTAEGKLNAFQLGRLAANQKIDVSLVRQLVTTGQISRYQALLVLEAERYSGTMKGAWAQVRLGASSLWSTLKGLFSWANIITFGIGAAMSAVMSHEQKLSEMDSKADSVTGKYKSKAEDISETLTKINNKVSKGSVDAMESALSKAGQLTDEVKNQVKEADTLTEKYEILRKKMEETLEMSKNLKNQELIGNVLKASNGDMVASPDEGSAAWLIRHIENGGNWIREHVPFSDKNGYASDNIAKINELENAIKNMASGLATSFDSVDKALKQTTDAAHDSVFYERVSKLPFEERIQAILRSGYADKFIKNLGKVDSNASLTASRLLHLIQSFDEYLQKLVSKNVPNIVSELKREMGLLYTDTKGWSNQQVNTFVLMFQQIMAAAGEMSDYVRSKVWQSFLASSQLGQNLNPSGMRVVTYTNGKGKKLYDSYIGKEGDDKRGHYVVVGYTGTKGHWREKKIYNPAADKPQAPSPTGSDEDIDGNKKNGRSGRGGSGSQKDTELEAVRNRVELYEKFYSEYKKLADYVGEGQALADLKASDDFKAVFGWKLSDVTNYSQSLDQLTKSLKGTNEERKKFLNDTDASKASKTRDDLMQKIKDNVAWANQQLDEFDAKYETYKKIVEATGNEDVANSVAFGRMPGDETSPRTKHDMIKSVLGDFYNMKPEDAETFLGLDRTQAEKQVGKESGQFKLWEANQKDGIKNLKDANDLLVDLMTKHQTIQDQIDAENKKYDDQLKLLELEKPHLTDEAYEKQQNSLTETHNQTVDSLNFQKFKQDSGWEDIFRDLDRVSTSRLRDLQSSIKNFMLTGSTADMKEEDVRSLVEALEKIQERIETTSPLSSIAQGYNDLSVLSSIMGQPWRKKANGNYILSEEEATRFGLKKSKNDEYTPEQLAGVRNGVYKGFENSIKAIETDFKALEGVLQPVTELFGTLGNKGISEGFGIADKAVGSMSNTMGNFKTLSSVADGFKLGGLSKALGKAGPYGAAAAAALSIGNSLLDKFGFGAAANKRYEKQERYYKQMISTMQDINSNLENRVSDSYGSRSIDAARKLVANYGAQASEARETYQDWSQAHTLHRNHRNRMYLFGGKGETQNYLDQINDFLRQNGYTGSQVGGDTIQNLGANWLKLIKEDMPDAWAHMNEEAQGYLNTIIEMEGDTEKLKEANDKLNEALTGMSFDGMKSEYESVLDDLDSDNDDLADSLEKKLREAILNSMISNLYKEQIEKAISDTANLAKNEEYVDKNGNIKRHTLRDSQGNLTYGETDIASEYTADEYNQSREEMRGITDDMMRTRDMLKDLYGWSDRNSSSMSSSVKGMTEEEGGLLASYVNAIRADVSIIRQTNGTYLPKLDITATAQLQQLNMITENTRRNAEAAERIDAAVSNMNDIFTRASNGAKPLHVDVK